MDKIVTGICPHCSGTIRISFEVGQSNLLKANWAAIDPLLGKESDATLAMRFGLQVVTIAARRRNRGIAPLHRAQNEAKVKEFENLLGVLPDMMIASQFKCSTLVVRNARIMKGIARVPARVGALVADREKFGKMLEIGLSYEDVARKYRVSRQRVEQVMSGSTHVTEP